MAQENAKSGLLYSTAQFPKWWTEHRKILAQNVLTREHPETFEEMLAAIPYAAISENAEFEKQNELKDVLNELLNLGFMRTRIATSQTRVLIKFYNHNSWV